MPLPKAQTPTGQGPKPSAPASAGRKPWKKKDHVDVVREQAEKLRAEITEAEAELSAKRRQLEKFDAAIKLFEES